MNLEIKSKDNIEDIVDMLVFGQLFSDQLEYFYNKSVKGQNLFKYNLKHDVSKLLKQIRNRVDQIFRNIPNNKEGIEAVMYLYDINYELLGQLNKMSLEDKMKLTNELKNKLNVK